MQHAVESLSLEQALPNREAITDVTWIVIVQQECAVQRYQVCVKPANLLKIEVVGSFSSFDCS